MSRGGCVNTEVSKTKTKVTRRKVGQLGGGRDYECTVESEGSVGASSQVVET
jgi:hypothetical protein